MTRSRKFLAAVALTAAAIVPVSAANSDGVAEAMSCSGGNGIVLSYWRRTASSAYFNIFDYDTWSNRTIICYSGSFLYDFYLGWP